MNEDEFREKQDKIYTLLKDLELVAEETCSHHTYVVYRDRVQRAKGIQDELLDAYKIALIEKQLIVISCESKLMMRDYASERDADRYSELMKKEIALLDRLKAIKGERRVDVTNPRRG